MVTSAEMRLTYRSSIRKELIMAEEKVLQKSYVEQWAEDHAEKTGTPSEEKMDILPQEPVDDVPADKKPKKK